MIITLGIKGESHQNLLMRCFKEQIWQIFIKILNFEHVIPCFSPPDSAGWSIDALGGFNLDVKISLVSLGNCGNWQSCRATCMHIPLFGEGLLIVTSKSMYTRPVPHCV